MHGRRRTSLGDSKGVAGDRPGYAHHHDRPVSKLGRISANRTSIARPNQFCSRKRRRALRSPSVLRIANDLQFVPSLPTIGRAKDSARRHGGGTTNRHFCISRASDGDRNPHVSFDSVPSATHYSVYSFLPLAAPVINLPATLSPAHSMLGRNRLATARI